VSAWVKGEKIRNKVTGRDEDADAKMMREVEELLSVDGEAKEHRETVLSMIAAWAIDHPGQEPRAGEIFPGDVERMQTAAFNKLRRPFAMLLRALVTHLRGEGAGLESTPRREAEAMAQRLITMGYEPASASDAASALLRDRYVDLL
jgi:predicted Ser/Thr protein kinase